MAEEPNGEEDPENPQVAEFAFVVPKAPEGATLKVKGPEGKFLHIPLPKNVLPGYKLVMQKNEQGQWVIKCAELPEAQKAAASVAAGASPSRGQAQEAAPPVAAGASPPRGQFPQPAPPRQGAEEAPRPPPPSQTEEGLRSRLREAAAAAAGPAAQRRPPAAVALEELPRHHSNVSPAFRPPARSAAAGPPPAEEAATPRGGQASTPRAQQAEEKREEPPAKQEELPRGPPSAPPVSRRSKANIAADLTGPDAVGVTLDTTKGPILMKIVPAWAPLGAERFLHLVRDGYYTSVAIYRAVPKFLCQFGIVKDPSRTRRYKKIQDDPLCGVPIEDGTVIFAAAGANTRKSTICLFLGDFPQLGSSPWETPIGKVCPGSMKTLHRIYTGYGDIPQCGGRGPDPHKLEKLGNDYIDSKFPKCDYVTGAFQS